MWLKGREPLPETLFDATPATVERHPIIELDPVNCTRQLGVPGPWWDRLPHFRMGFTPSKGDELQAEYLLPRECAVDAIRALREVPMPGLLVCELRTVAADSLWMSPMYGRDTLAVPLHVRAGADRRRAARDRGRARARSTRVRIRARSTSPRASTSAPADFERARRAA